MRWPCPTPGPAGTAGHYGAHLLVDRDRGRGGVRAGVGGQLPGPAVPGRPAPWAAEAETQGATGPGTVTSNDDTVMRCGELMARPPPHRRHHSASPRLIRPPDGINDHYHRV